MKLLIILYNLTEAAYCHGSLDDKDWSIIYAPSLDKMCI